MVDNILVTGALGNVGTEIVNLLNEQGYPVRTADINQSALHQRFTDQAEVVFFDFARPETFAGTFRELSACF